MNTCSKIRINYENGTLKCSNDHRVHGTKRTWTQVQFHILYISLATSCEYE